MKILGLSRIAAVALLILGALVLFVIIAIPVVQIVPSSVTDSSHGATVQFFADDTTVLVDSDCVLVHWKTENIQAVEVDHDGMIGEGSRKSCTARATLDVTFRDGATQTYTIDKQIRFGSMVMRILLVVAVFLFGLGIVVSDVPQAFLRRLRSSGLSRRLDAVLPSQRRDVVQSTTPVVILTMAVIVLIGAVVRTYFLSKSLRYDESSNFLHFASLPLFDVLSTYDSTNNHIFHTLLVHISTSILGVYPWTMRLGAYFAGILIVPAIFAVGREFYSVRVGLVAAAIASASSWMVEYSAYARGYSLITLDFLILLLIAAALTHRQTARRWALFAFFCALGVLTIPIMIFPIGIVAAWLGLSFVQNSDGRHFWRPLGNLLVWLIVGGILTLIFYTPALLHILSAQQLDTRFNITQPIGWIEFSYFFRTELVIVWKNLQRDLSPWLFALLVIGFFASLIFHGRLARYRVNWIRGALLWLPVVNFIQFVPTFERFWVYLYPTLLIMAVAGLFYLAQVLGRRFGTVSMRALVPVTVLIALILGVGEMRSNSIQVASGPGSAAGTESVFRYAHETLPNENRLFCANYCMAMDLYGMIYDIHIDGIKDDTELPDKPFYIIMVATAPVDDLKTLRRTLFWKPEQIASITPVFDAGDAVLYRLVPATPAAS